MKTSSMFPSRYIKAADLAGGELMLTMETVQMEVMPDDKEVPVLYFVDEKRGLCLNKTNTLEIEDAYGDDSEVWNGKRIVLFKGRTQYAGKMVDCVRVRVPSPAKPSTIDAANRELETAAAESDTDTAPWE